MPFGGVGSTTVAGLTGMLVTSNVFQLLAELVEYCTTLESMHHQERDRVRALEERLARLEDLPPRSAAAGPRRSRKRGTA